MVIVTSAEKCKGKKKHDSCHQDIAIKHGSDTYTSIQTQMTKLLPFDSTKLRLLGQGEKRALSE